MKQPTLLVPYAGPDASGNSFDVYMYLRPETNGVLTESVIMKTIVSAAEWKKGVKLVYMANYPGDFIHTRHLIEHHYRLKVHFARKGGKSFTPGMIRAFEEQFRQPFNPDKVLGSFDALEYTGLDEENLFSYRVHDEDMLVALGQNIKRYGDIWIVNYDIPAILHRNTFETDIAVMVFRVALSWEEFQKLVSAMSEHLVEAGILDPHTAPSRAFHHSKSPWEQLLDGIDFLWGVNITDGGAEDDISFGAYMMNRGYSRETLKDIIRNPLVIYRDKGGEPGIPGEPGAAADSGSLKEANIFELCTGMNYADAEAAWKRVVAPVDLSTDVTSDAPSDLS
jgi:hypothetical protein